MSYTLTLPEVGETVTEGTIEKWLKAPGDKVAKYEPIVEVNTDKVNVELPSPVTGTVLKILVAEGETVPIGADLCTIDQVAGETPAEMAPAAPSEQLANEPVLEVDTSVVIAETPSPTTDTSVLVLDEDDEESDTPILVLDTDDAEVNMAPVAKDTDTAPKRQYSNAARHRQPRRREKKVTIHVERETAKERRKLTWGQVVLLSVLASLTLGLSGRHAYLTWRGLVEEGKTAQRNTVASAKAVQSGQEKTLAEARKKQASGTVASQATVQRDHENRVLRVTGPNPMTVLMAYCEAASDTYEREPLELAQATPPTPNERFGIFRDFSRLETNRAIRISQDRETQRWVAGDGQTPIPTRDAPAEPDTIRRASLNDGS